MCRHLFGQPLGEGSTLGLRPDGLIDAWPANTYIAGGSERPVAFALDDEGEIRVEDIRQPGEFIGPYVVKGWLGGGGSSHVYVASSGTDHNFAVKVCRQNLRELPADSRHEHVARLTREFNVLQTLSHDNIVRVFSFGWTDEDDDGLSTTPYIVMEVVEGIPLDRVLKGQQLPLMVLLEIFRKVVGAVAYLHRKKIVHRDIKPGNVVIRENGSPVLLDFGIVRAPWFETLTKPQQILGTLDFMSPEGMRACGTDGVYRSKATDDVYALGVMLYRVLTGAMPAQGNPIQRMQGRHMPPRHPCQVAPRVPRPLGDLTMRMLEPAPAKRLQDGQVVLDELEPLLTELRPHLFAPAPERMTEPLSAIVAAPSPRRREAATTTEQERLGWLAALAFRRMWPWVGSGLAVLAGVAWLVLRSPRTPIQQLSGEQAVSGDVRRQEGSLQDLGQKRLPLWDWQARPPCLVPGKEQDGGCWVDLNDKPPCPAQTWEKGGKCWLPVHKHEESRPPQAGDGGKPTQPPEAQE